MWTEIVRVWPGVNPEISNVASMPRAWKRSVTDPAGIPVRTNLPELSVVVAIDIPTTLTEMPALFDAAATSEAEAAATKESTVPWIVAPCIVDEGAVTRLDAPPPQATSPRPAATRMDAVTLSLKPVMILPFWGQRQGKKGRRSPASN
jgi:hypothetical protein